MSFFEKLKNGLKKTRESITQRVDQLLVSLGKIDEELFEELEEILITSDVGVDTTLKIIDSLRQRVRAEKVTDPGEVKNLLKEEISKILESGDSALKLETKPSVIVVVGVNGVGKTTSIGYICNMLKMQGTKVPMAAGDTFRAAAID